ncbi:MAG: 4-hydroxy-tetrahydrodipicolinate reductase [Lachnospiraceae bacterium]|nr:4-hydroxy-tetrahydrodipicolinate reductase [Lachnospiraceae bacterium]
MKVLISGITGHMGKILSDMISQDNDLEVTCGVSKNQNDTNIKCFHSFSDINVDVDIVVDFSHHSLTKEMVDFAIKKNIALVIATTGQTDDEKKIIKEASNTIPIFFASNYSMGIATLIESAKQVASRFKNADIEIVETHHNRKLDAPSGTALKIAESLKGVRPDANLVLGRSGNTKREKNDICISSIRLGNVVGIHEVLISTEHECISLKHEAYDRRLFAEGAINAIKFMNGKPKGFYTMDDMINI